MTYLLVTFIDKHAEGCALLAIILAVIASYTAGTIARACSRHKPGSWE